MAILRFPCSVHPFLNKVFRGSLLLSAKSTPHIHRTSRFNCVTAVSRACGHRSVGKWLVGLSAMTFGAVVLGGATRLTESGLSMVDWHPFKEAPPSSDEQWIAEFNKYKEFPEYQYHVQQHGEMSLSRFKFIWYMEYTHRMWGRMIGAMFALPGAYFWYKGYFNSRMKPRFLIYGGLIGFQVCF
ncbi:cytochrome c oxidase assembly protein subunit 15 [Paragonimus westermani]|uniref:Cytochrome c oxidase assembly protein subunit 15 n=1 Tax=Paragonimus westermani TaxID=34504 RepID=A0A5J4NQZ9_9TREM|nr:cytochrome c oxidase assembly protein subunit 15 [Paragonimus westermani]